MKTIFSFLLLVILSNVLFFLVRNGEGQHYRLPVRIGESEIYVTVSDTPISRAQGLSGTTSLEPNTGMLFVFEEPGLYGFWMKEMNYSIDMLWLDREKKIVHVESNVLPSSYPQIFISKTDAQYVLEVPAGFVSKNLVNIGDFAVWNFN